MEKNIIEANIKMLDKNKLLLSDINVLVRYIKGNKTKKEEMHEEVKNIVNYYLKQGK